MLPWTGLVAVIVGLMHWEANDHGFGTGPVTRGFPVVSCPVVMFTVYALHSRRDGVGVSVRAEFPSDHVGVTVVAGVIVHATVTGFIGSLKRMKMGVDSGTFGVEATGLVRMMYGLAGGAL
jgi:hypothetical protein